MNLRKVLRLGALALAIGPLVALMMLGLSARSALAESEIGSLGTGAGQISDPRSVAVDEAEDLLYVADRGNNRIDVFDASTGAFVKAFGWGVLNGASELQVCTTACLAGIAGSGSGQLESLSGIAVDNDPGSSGFHSIYVFEGGNSRVQKFSPAGEFVWMVGDGVNVTTGGDLCTSISGHVCGPGASGSAAGQFNGPDGDTIEVGPSGTVYVGDRVVDSGISKTRVQLYSPAGAYLGYLGGKLLEVAGGAGNARALAVDSGGNIYAGTSGGFSTGAVRKYDPSGNELVVFNKSFNVNAVAVDPEDHVFVADNSTISKILEYDSAGTLLRVFYGSLIGRVVGLAPYPVTPLGDIFAAEEASLERSSRVVAIDFPAPGPVVYPKPSGTFANPIGNTKATLNAQVNPEGQATTYHFEYISDEDFKAAGETFGAGTIETPESSSVGSDFELHAAQAQITGLFPETVYHFRLVATNASGTDIGPTASFETKEPVEFGEHWTTDVGITSATLHAEVNPLGISSTARFQYTELADTTYENAQEAPAEAIDLGEGEAMIEVSAPVTGLKEGTAYRYRLVVTNRCKPEPAPLCDFAEEEGTFTTFVALGPITGCPNDLFRKEGNGQFLPDCRAYEMVSPVDKEGANIEPLANINGFPAGLDQAALDGDSITYSAYKAFGNAISAPFTDQYLARRDATTGWQSEAISPKREGPSIMTYLSAQLDRQYKAFSEDLCDGWIVQDANPTLAPEGIDGFPGLYRRDNCAPEVGSYEALTTVEPPNLAPKKFIPEFQGASADGSVAIYGVNDNLTPDAPPQPLECVEETSPSAEPCQARLYEARDGQLEYVCILPNETPHTGECGAGTTANPISGAAERSGSLANAISDDGSHIFWSASAAGAPASLYVRIGGTETIEISAAPARFRKAAADGSKAIYSVGQQLFVFDVATETATPIANGVSGVAGASEDASRIYFASSEVLTGSQQNSVGDVAVKGRGNLYLYEAGSEPDLTFIASLSATETEEAGTSPVSRFPARRLSRVTADGQHLAFMSLSPLTGYDNTDASSKELDFEVFLYDAVEEELLCPSCNPTNARPEGRKLTQKLLEGRWAAARIPTYPSQLYPSRLISADGNRLYFNSFEALVSTDSNGQEDVYQWQEPGTGSCTTSSPTYHEVSGGCVDLISSGKSPQGSEIVDISADGRDVFFKTYSSLVGQDPGRLDVYDARVQGGFKGPVAPPIVCEGEFCQSPAPTPAVGVAPATQAAGPGNPAWPKPKPRKCPRGKHKVKRAGKVVCVKNKKKKAQRNRVNLSAGVER